MIPIIKHSYHHDIALTMSSDNVGYDPILIGFDSRKHQTGGGFGLPVAIDRV
jgi:hypothetical protein